MANSDNQGVRSAAQEEINSFHAWMSELEQCLFGQPSPLKARGKDAEKQHQRRPWSEAKLLLASSLSRPSGYPRSSRKRAPIRASAAAEISRAALSIQP